MDDRKPDPKHEAHEKAPKTERINGQEIPVMTIEEFSQAVFGKPAEEAIKLKLVRLSVAKFMTAWGKFYRLAWSGRGKRWLAAENTTEFRSRYRTVAAGVELAAQKGVEFAEGQSSN